MNEKFWATAFTLTGTIIGAGILGLPYVFSKSGIFIGLGWLFILGIIMIYVNLCLGEISLRTKENHQLVGYAKKYLGKKGEKLMFFAVIFGIYSALIAYLIGEGQSLSMLLTGNLDNAIYFAIGFWLVITIVLREGLKGLKKIETWGVLAIISVVFLILILYFPQINIENYKYNDFGNFFFPFGVILFSLLGFASIPELRREIRGSEIKFKKAIIIGASIPILLYIIFCFVFVGVLGNNVLELATLNFGGLVTILGIFTMLTSYFVLSFSLKDMFDFDLSYSKTMNFFSVSIFPLLIYLILSFFNLFNFVEVLGVGGVISGGLTGILILFMNKKAKKKGDRKPEYKVYINWFFIVLLSFVFLVGMLFVLFGNFLF